MSKVKDRLTRHAHFVERYKTGQANQFNPYLKRVDRVLRDLLSRSQFITNRKRLVAIQKKARDELYVIYKEWSNHFKNELVDFAASEAAFSARAIGANLAIPSKQALWAAVASRPFNNKLLREELADFASSQVKLVKNAIAQGFYRGDSNQDIIRTIRGTKANNYKDGLLSISNRAASRIVRTAVNHTASTARMSLLEANADLYDEYEISATIDTRTSDICDDLDGEVFKVGKGPRPPFHPNCRTTILPVI